MKDSLEEYTKGERIAVCLINWGLLIFAPVWAPVMFWYFAITGKNFFTNMFTGKRLISE